MLLCLSSELLDAKEEARREKIGFRVIKIINIEVSRDIEFGFWTGKKGT